MKCKISYSVKLYIRVTQHSRDKLLMNFLINILGCGNVYDSSNENAAELRISKFNEIKEKMIPFFNKYEIRGVKTLDYDDFCKAAILIKDKVHLTSSGLEEIRKIKSRKNKARYTTRD